MKALTSMINTARENIGIVGLLRAARLAIGGAILGAAIGGVLEPFLARHGLSTRQVADYYGAGVGFAAVVVLKLIHVV